MTPLNISKITARRYIMGKQGLWPGRRFQGVDGAADALRQHTFLDDVAHHHCPQPGYRHVRARA